MSYILDALRRAEAQRSRGHLPGLHEAAAGGAVLASPPATASPRLLPLMVLLLIGGALAVSWILLREPTTVVAPSALPAVAMDTAASGAAVAETASNQITSAPASDAEPLLALPRDAVVVKREAAAVASPKPAPAQPAAKAEPPAAASRPTAAVAVALPSRQQLPPEVQRDIPQISVSGAVYSADPSQRMLVINGELWREGDQIRPDLILEEIRRHDAVLRFRGVSFTVSP